MISNPHIELASDELNLFKKRYLNSRNLFKSILQPFYPTIEDIYVANVDTDRHTKENLRFLDTQGITDNAVKEIPRHWHAIADAFLIVYSIDDSHSFQLAEVILRDIERHREKKEAPIVVLANKTDLSTKRQVDATQALNWSSREKIKLFEVSALDKGTLLEPLVYLSSRLNPPQAKSTFPQINIGRRHLKSSSNNE